MNSPAEAFLPVARNMADYVRFLVEMHKPGQPTFFKLRAQLPAQGRTDTPVAATDEMTVVLKTYASDGENELHAHTREDHTFIVLQGRAIFYGPKGETKSVGAMEGVLLPRGTFYWFRAEGAEQLVMVRVGSSHADPQNPASRFDRIGADGKPMLPDSKENKEVELIMSDKVFGPESFGSVK